jgi:hypothetical protein
LPQPCQCSGFRTPVHHHTGAANMHEHDRNKGATLGLPILSSSLPA